jgi:plastocyanin
LEDRARLGVSRVALTSVLIVVVAVAGTALYLTSTPSSTSSVTSRTTSSTSGGSLVIAMSPPSPLIAPGETQNYSSVEIQTVGSGLNGTLAIRAFAPAGISLFLDRNSVSLADDPQSIPLSLKAGSEVSPGMYNFSLETSSATLAARNQTFTIDVVPVLVIIQNLAFHPQNITVPLGTSVSWINLDAQIGCCDPGNHNVVFLSGANASSPILKRFDTWSYEFGTPGVVDYYCSIHPLIMKGQVTVTR